MTKTDSDRIIHTGVFSTIAQDLFGDVLGQMSDGWGENSSHWEKFWPFADIERDEDGEVIIRISSKTYAPYYNKRNGFEEMKDEEILPWFAYFVKKTAIMELKDNYNPNKFGSKEIADMESGYLSGTFGDIYDFWNKFRSPETVTASANILGTPLDEEQKQAIADVAYIQEKFNTWRKDEEALKEAQIKAIREAMEKEIKKIENEYTTKYSAVWAENKKKKDAIKEKFPTVFSKHDY